MKEQFAVFGSDARQAAAGRALARAGYAVGGAEQLATADYLLLPMPLDAQQLGLCRLLRAAKPGALALGGLPGPDACRIAQQCGIELVDYYQEPLALRNAVPTAEGCIGLLLHHRTRTLAGSPVLVLGFGRVGQALAVRLAALGARVTLAARSPAQRAHAQSLGMTAVPLTHLPALAPGFDTVVNTVPAPVLTQEVLAQLPPSALICDLSPPPWRHGFCCRCPAGAHRPPCTASARPLRTGQRRRGGSPDRAGGSWRKGGCAMDKKTRGRVAFAVCGSFCTLDAALVQAERLVQDGWQLIR